MIVLLQSRLSSSRLPAKALLPIRGMPSVVLAAKRGGNRGAHVRIITSTDPSDDILAKIAKSHGLDLFRGHLTDVLARTVAATEGLPDETVAVRLTGDNMFPDQSLIDAVAEELQRKELDYAGIRWPDDGLPYGVSVEAFRVGTLRRAHLATDSNFDREHTTPWLRRHCKAGNWKEMAYVDAARLRCTIDNLDDYLAMLRVFDAVTDPINATWMALVDILARQPSSPPGLLPHIPYWGAVGDVSAAARISNVVVDATATAQVAGAAAVDRLHAAINCGVTHFLVNLCDGPANSLVARGLSCGWSSRVGVIGVLQVEDCACLEQAVAQMALQLCYDLRIECLDTLLLPAGLRTEAWASIQTLKNRNVCRHVGIWGTAADPAAKCAEVVLDRFPPGPGVPALGRRIPAPHVVTVLSQQDVWSTLASLSSSANQH